MRRVIGGGPRFPGRVFLRLVYHKPLESLTAFSFLMWFTYFLAPWNPWDINTTSAQAMDAVAPRWLWITIVGVGTALKVLSIITRGWWLRIIGSVWGFSFWTFITVVVLQSAPYSLLAIQFITMALASAIIFWSLLGERRTGSDLAE